MKPNKDPHVAREPRVGQAWPIRKNTADTFHCPIGSRPCPRHVSLNWMFLCLVANFCRGRRVGEYPRDQRLQNWSAIHCICRQRPRAQESSFPKTPDAWSRGTNLKQRWFGLRGSSSLWSKVTAVRGRGFRIASIPRPSASQVLREWQSVPIAALTRMFRTDRMNRYQTAPMWLTVSGLKCQAMPLCHSWLWIEWGLKSSNSSLRTRSSQLVPLSLSGLPLPLMKCRKASMKESVDKICATLMWTALVRRQV